MENGNLSKEKSRFRHVNKKEKRRPSNCFIEKCFVLPGKAESCIVKEAPENRFVSRKGKAL